MTVKTDEFAGVAVRPYGEFLGTYESDQSQVSAQLFQKDGMLQALLSYHRNLDTEQITDEYLKDLRQIAAERGLILKLLHVAR